MPAIGVSYLASSKFMYELMKMSRAAVNGTKECFDI